MESALDRTSHNMARSANRPRHTMTQTPNAASDASAHSGADAGDRLHPDLARAHAAAIDASRERAIQKAQRASDFARLEPYVLPGELLLGVRTPRQLLALASELAEHGTTCEIRLTGTGRTTREADGASRWRIDGKPRITVCESTADELPPALAAAIAEAEAQLGRPLPVTRQHEQAATQDSPLILQLPTLHNLELGPPKVEGQTQDPLTLAQTAAEREQERGPGLLTGHAQADWIDAYFRQQGHILRAAGHEVARAEPPPREYRKCMDGTRHPPEPLPRPDLTTYLAMGASGEFDRLGQHFDFDRAMTPAEAGRQAYNSMVSTLANEGCDRVAQARAMLSRACMQRLLTNPNYSLELADDPETGTPSVRLRADNVPTLAQTEQKTEHDRARIRELTNGGAIADRAETYRQRVQEWSKEYFGR